MIELLKSGRKNTRNKTIVQALRQKTKQKETHAKFYCFRNVSTSFSFLLPCFFSPAFSFLPRRCSSVCAATGGCQASTLLSFILLLHSSTIHIAVALFCLCHSALSCCCFTMQTLLHSKNCSAQSIGYCHLLRSESLCCSFCHSQCLTSSFLRHCMPALSCAVFSSSPMLCSASASALSCLPLSACASPLPFRCRCCVLFVLLAGSASLPSFLLSFFLVSVSLVQPNCTANLQQPVESSSPQMPMGCVVVELLLAACCSFFASALLSPFLFSFLLLSSSRVLVPFLLSAWL